MLGVHLMQQWVNLSNPEIEDSLIEVSTMCLFAGIDLNGVWIPDQTRIRTGEFYPRFLRGDWLIWWKPPRHIAAPKLSKRSGYSSESLNFRRPGCEAGARTTA
jgi:hypothetical protein